MISMRVFNSYKKYVLLTILFLSLYAHSQTFKGIVRDFDTKEPVPFVTIYFEGTTIITTSKIDGSYEITKKEHLKTDLVYRIIGYKRKKIIEPTVENTQIIYLKPDVGELNAIYLESTKDPWSRRVKEREFLKYFLGETKFSTKSEVANLDQVYLKFDKKTKSLTAYCESPLIVKHPYLGYEITYDLSNFKVTYDDKVNPDGTRDYFANNAFLNGSLFYKNLDLEPRKLKRVLKRRLALYHSSEVYFLKSIVNDSLEANKFFLLERRKKLEPKNHLRVRNHPYGYKVVFRNEEYNIIDRFKNRSSIILLKPFIEVSPYYHNISEDHILFSGFMGKLKVTGMLPLDYKPQSGLNNE